MSEGYFNNILSLVNWQSGQWKGSRLDFDVITRYDINVQRY
jgi:hypothetical protein